MVRLLQDCAIVGKPINWSGSTHPPIYAKNKNVNVIKIKQKYIAETTTSEDFNPLTTK